MPIYALLAVLFGIAFARLWTTLQQSDARQPLMLLLLTAVFVQIAAGIYNPGDYLPVTENTAAVRAAVDLIRTTPGDVYVATIRTTITSPVSRPMPTWSHCMTPCARILTFMLNCTVKCNRRWRIRNSQPLCWMIRQMPASWMPLKAMPAGATPFPCSKTFHRLPRSPVRTG